MKLSTSHVSLGALLISGLIMVANLSSCGDKKNGQPMSGSGTADGNINIKMAASSSIASLTGTEGCDCSTPGTSRGGPVCGSNPQGKCYTPTAIRGHFNALNGGGSRLLGGGNKYHGLESVFRTGYFDLANPVALDGDDNIQDGAKTSTSIVSMSIQSVEYQFLAAGKYFNVRIPMVTVPAKNDTAFVGCIDESGLGESLKYTKLYADGIAVSAGDILACIKDTKTETCKDSEFNWVDANGVLTPVSGTRPSEPLRLTGLYAFNKSSCAQGADHPSVTWGGLDLHAATTSTFGVTAEIKEGKKIYTKGSESGNTLDVTIAMDFSNQLFVPNAAASAFASSDYATDGVTVRKNLDKITLRQIYQYNTRTSASTNIDSDNLGTATLSVAISTKEEAADGDVEDLSTTLKPSSK